MHAVVWTPLTHALMITAFVAVIMIIVEYVSVLTRGAFQDALSRGRWAQYATAAILGALPGCLGPFTIVALYTHRAVSFGAVVTTMIATSGDEAFVMFAMIPTKALWLTLALAALGFAVGPLADGLARKLSATQPCTSLVLHEDATCRCFPGVRVLEQWNWPTAVRGALTASMIGFVAAIATGIVGPSQWNWVRATLLSVGLVGGFVVSTVPDHFLRDHLWNHVIVKHVPPVFIWTLGVLTAVAVLERLVDLDAYVQANAWGVLGAAGLLGVIPESGPHLVFVTLFRDGIVPFSILLSSSIVQDGHGMLPLLAESRRDFLWIKGINLVIGLAVGAILLTLGL
jgi:hypothetical protein